MSKENEIQAFPLDRKSAERIEEGYGVDEKWMGMTLRDYFAAKIINGFCGDKQMWNNLMADAQDHDRNLYVATQAYMLADAMLEARTK